MQGGGRLRYHIFASGRVGLGLERGKQADSALAVAQDHRRAAGHRAQCYVALIGTRCRGRLPARMGVHAAGYGACLYDGHVIPSRASPHPDEACLLRVDEVKRAPVRARR